LHKLTENPRTDRAKQQVRASLIGQEEVKPGPPASGQSGRIVSRHLEGQAIPASEVIGVHMTSCCHLAQIVDADGSLSSLFGLRQGRQEHRGEDGNNSNDDQKLDERETRASPKAMLSRSTFPYGEFHKPDDSTILQWHTFRTCRPLAEEKDSANPCVCWYCSYFIKTAEIAIRIMGSFRGCPKTAIWLTNVYSMPEMAQPGKDHRQIARIGGRYHFHVADRTSRLNRGSCASIRGRNQAIGEGKERITADNAPLKR